MLTNNDLKEITLNFLELLAIYFDGNMWNKTSFNYTDGTLSISRTNSPNFNQIIWQLYYANKIPFFQKYIEKIEEDNRFIKYKSLININNPGTNWLSSRKLIIDFITNYLQEVNTFIINTELLDKMIDNFQNSFTRGTDRFSYFTVLRGVKPIVEEIKISKNIIIRNLDKKALEQLMDIHPILADEDNIPINTCIIESIHELSIFENYNYMEKDRIIFENIIKTLRIIQPGKVDFQNIYQRGLDIGSIKFGFSICKENSSSIYRRFAFTNNCNLEQIDWTMFKIIFKKLEKKGLNNKIDIAVDRLNFAYNRVEFSDKILDLIIALEAIYGDANGAINYKIGLRASIFLYNDIVKRKECSKLINDAYKSRSSIVHNGSKGKSIQINQLFDIVRLTISKILITTQNNEQINGEYFDNLIYKSKLCE